MSSSLLLFTSRAVAAVGGTKISIKVNSDIETIFFIWVSFPFLSIAMYRVFPEFLNFYESACAVMLDLQVFCKSCSVDLSQSDRQRCVVV